MKIEVGEDKNFHRREASKEVSFLELQDVRNSNPGSKMQGDERRGEKERWRGEEEGE